MIPKKIHILTRDVEILDAMREIWPEDPAKGDFALFGYGINHK